jgi:hypothetical protein
MDTKREMFKQAAVTLRKQNEEIHSLREKLAQGEIAEHIISKLVENNVLPIEDVLNKLSELRNKPLEDLEVMEKAAELYQGNIFSGFGKLSDIPDGQGLDPLTAFLLSEGD